VPSAVFTSVTGLFSLSVIVGAPEEYEPPEIEILAVCAVTETRWKSGLSCGKSLAVATV
jgi:hypothetical protein